MNEAGAAAPSTASPQAARYRFEDLLGWTTRVLVRCGVSSTDAALAAGVLLRTSLRGIDTHGISRIPAYVAKLRSGEVKPAGRPHLRWQDGALSVEGGHALGQVVADAALREAIARSSEQACVACSIRNSGHLSALGMFVLQASEQGRVALLCQRTPPIMAMPGAHSPAIGNNPIAFAAPLQGRPPVVFDMANSVVARGHVMQAARDGSTMPDTWALGPEGLPTTDPALALRGAMQPIAGHKGMGLAMMVECLAGALSGAVDGPHGPPDGGSAGGVSAFLLVLNPAMFMGQRAYDEAMSSWTARYLEAAGSASRLPGHRQAACELERRGLGIPVTESVRDELMAVGDLVGITFDCMAHGARSSVQAVRCERRDGQ